MLQCNDKGVACISWKGCRLRELPVGEVCAFGKVFVGCALEFAVCIMTVSKGVVNVLWVRKCIQYLGGVMVK